MDGARLGRTHIARQPAGVSLNQKKPSEDERKAILQQLEPYPGAIEHALRYMAELKGDRWEHAYYNDTQLPTDTHDG
jgi:hypothetical protein